MGVKCCGSACANGCVAAEPKRCHLPRSGMPVSVAVVVVIVVVIIVVADNVIKEKECQSK